MKAQSAPRLPGGGPLFFESRVVHAALAAFLLTFALLIPRVDRPGAAEESSEKEARISATVLNEFSFGQSPAVTDWLLLKMLTDADRSWVEPGERASHYYTLMLASEVDPLFYELYTEGPRLLAVVRNDKDGSVELSEKGLKVQRTLVPSLPESRRSYVWPSLFEVPFVQGYLYLFEKPDLTKAAEAYAEASRAPEAPAYIASLASRLSDRKERFEVGLRVLKAMKSSARTEQEQARFDERIRNLYLIQYLDALRAEFETFLQSQPHYLKEVHLPKERMQQLFERFMKGARLEPKDPFGGRVFVDDSGQVTTTTPYESEMGLR